MDYYEVIVKSTDDNACDVLTAAFAEIGFESFEQEQGLLKAYIPVSAFSESEYAETCAFYKTLFDFVTSKILIPSKNWNTVWESNFQPISVEDKVRVRAVFHEPDANFPIELVIQPKMSFGTGHHATTWLVMRAMLDIDFSGKKVMDFGTGTGILAILAKKRNAKALWAVDNDPQCVENAQENFELNDCKKINLCLGNINAFGELTYDIIIGNITRNVIIEFFHDISIKLQVDGLFIASGFYDEDVEVLREFADKSGLKLLHTNTREKWCMAIFQKK